MIILTALLVAAHRILGMEKNHVFLLGVLFFGIKDMCRLITESLYYILNMKFLQGLYNESVIYRNAAVGYSAVMVLRFGLLFIMLLLISRRLQKEALELHAKELCYLCLMPIAGILFGNIIFRLFFTVKENVFFQLYEQYPVFIGLVPLTSVLFYAGIVITIMSYQEMVSLQEERKKYFVEEQQLRAIRESLEAFELTIRTGNAVTDVIVNDKQKAAEKQGIKFSSEFLYPVSSGYDAYDIAIIINNLLQNALEACERMEGGKRYIFLSGRHLRRRLLHNLLWCDKGRMPCGDVERRLSEREREKPV